jgi:hypothetical protein
MASWHLDNDKVGQCARLRLALRPPLRRSPLFSRDSSCFFLRTFFACGLVCPGLSALAFAALCSFFTQENCGFVSRFLLLISSTLGCRTFFLFFGLFLTLLDIRSCVAL